MYIGEASYLNLAMINVKKEGTRTWPGAAQPGQGETKVACEGGGREVRISGPGRETGSGAEVGGGAVSGSKSRIIFGSELQNRSSKS